MSVLPSEEQLKQWYAELRLKYFHVNGSNKLPPVHEVSIEWSNRLTASAGICYPKKRIIRLSTHYHRRFPEEVRSTLLHEMIHLIVPGHGPEFYAWLNAIRRQGGRVARYAKARATPHGSPRWRYECVRCGRSMLRRRRLRHGGRDYIHAGCGGRLQETALEGDE